MEIILGKSKTGKSKYIYECIVEDIKNNERPILFVPSQTRVITEENYMKYLNLDGIIGVNVTTISEYVSNIMKKLNIHYDDNYLSKLDKKIIMTQVIKENEDLFKIFKKVKNKDGFFENLNIYMDIFRKESLDIDKISSLSLKNKFLENKLKEMFQIYSKYKEKIEEKYIDNISEIDILSENENLLKEMLKKSTIYFDGYNNFTNSELKFIKLLMLIGVNIKITLKTDICELSDIEKNNTEDIFEVANETYINLLKLASATATCVETKVMYNNYSNASKEIIYLAENIFSNNKIVKKEKNIDCNNVHLNVYQNVYKEVESVAYKICKKIKSGCRYSDFCVYTTDIDNYSNIFSRVFYEYNIPFYVDTKVAMETTKLVQYILGLLNLGNSGLNIENTLNILKLGLNDIDKIDLAYFENYIFEFNINNYSINKKFYLNNDGYNEVIYDLDRLNIIREKVIDIFEDISKNSKENMSIKEIISLIYNHLIKNNILNNYNSYFDDIEEKSYYIYTTSIKNQVFEKVSDTFDSIFKIYENSKIKLSEFLQIFKLLLKDMSLKTIPPTKDKVTLADINVSRCDMKKYVFFVGVIEGGFPKKQQEDLFFSDYEIENLKNIGIKFKETTISKENMGLYNIYEALSNVQNELYISMPSTDILSNSTRKSSFILLLQKTIPIKLVGEVISSSPLDMDYNDIYSKEKAFEYMILKLKECESLIDNLDNTKIFKSKVEEILSLYKYFQNDEKYNELLNYIKDDSNLSISTINKIYKDGLKSSVYKLELFKGCPFSYYMKYILNISKTKKVDITSMDLGSFIHNVLEKFSFYLFENNIFWHEILKDKNTLELKYQDVLYDIITKQLDESFKKQKESVKYTIYKQKLTNTLKKVMVIIARGFNQSEFLPYGYELSFKDGGDLLPIEIELDNNSIMKIVGKIDRIDTFEDGKNVYARVIDYKSSGKTLTVDKIKEGISLQLITYLTAFVESKNKLKDILFLKNNVLDNEKKDVKVLPCATLYFNLSDKLLNLKDYTKDESIIQKELIKTLRMNGLFLKDVKIIEKMDKCIGNANEKLIDVSPNRSSKKLLEQEEFENLCQEAKEVLKQIGNEMIKGRVSISPSKKSKPCEYCDFSNICRKNICL